MKLTVLFLAFVLNTVISFSQELVRKSEKTKNMLVTKKYQVLKSDKKVKCGEYFLLFGNKNIIQSGFYNQDKKDSIWSYFSIHGDSLYQYDYDQNKLINYNWRNQEKMMNIKIDGEWKSGAVDSPPLSLDYEIKSFVASSLSYPFQAIEYGLSGRVIISVVIDKSGTPTRFSVHTSSNDLFDKEAMRVAKEIKEWYPAIYQGEAVDCEYFIPFTFSPPVMLKIN